VEALGLLLLLLVVVVKMAPWTAMLLHGLVWCALGLQLAHLQG
jgi:hypothetical protein